MSFKVSVYRIFFTGTAIFKTSECDSFHYCSPSSSQDIFQKAVDFLHRRMIAPISVQYSYYTELYSTDGWVIGLVQSVGHLSQRVIRFNIEYRR